MSDPALLAAPAKFVCASCQSAQVMREAWAAWDVAAQRWQLGELFDYAFCKRCHRRTRIEAQPAEA